MNEKSFNPYIFYVYCMNFHTMTLEEIKQNIIDNNNKIATYKMEMNSVYGSGYSTSTDYYTFISNCKAENKRLIPIVKRLEKINHLLG